MQQLSIWAFLTREWPDWTGHTKVHSPASRIMNFSNLTMASDLFCTDYSLNLAQKSGLLSEKVLVILILTGREGYVTFCWAAERTITVLCPKRQVCVQCCVYGYWHTFLPALKFSWLCAHSQVLTKLPVGKSSVSHYRSCPRLPSWKFIFRFKGFMNTRSRANPASGFNISLISWPL